MCAGQVEAIEFPADYLEQVKTAKQFTLWWLWLLWVSWHILW